MKLSTFLFCFVGLLALTFAQPEGSLPYGKSSGVIELTKENFAKNVFNSEHVWIVEFYAPWCGHCKRLAPEWEKLARSLKGIVKVGAVNCDEQKEIPSTFGIQGFPTIKLFPSEAGPAPGGKGLYKQPVDYNGPRSASEISRWALEHLPNFVEQVSGKNEEKFLSSNTDLAKVLLFTEKKKTTNLYKALAIDFHNQLALGEVRNTETALVEKYSVSKYPSLVVITTTGEQVTYDGDLKHDPLFNFLKPYAKELKKSGSSKSSSKDNKKESAPPVVEEPVRPVKDQVVDQATLESVCFNTNKNCFIGVLDTVNNDATVHEGYVAILEKLQKKYEKLFNFIWVDGVEQYEWTEKLNLASGFPAALVYNHKKTSMIPYVGAFTEEQLTEFLEKILIGSKRAVPTSSFPPLKTVKKSKDEL